MTVGILNIDKIRHIVRPTLLALYKLTTTHIQNKHKIRKNNNRKLFS